MRDHSIVPRLPFHFPTSSLTKFLILMDERERLRKGGCEEDVITMIDLYVEGIVRTGEWGRA